MTYLHTEYLDFSLYFTYSNILLKLMKNVQQRIVFSLQYLDCRIITDTSYNFLSLVNKSRPLYFLNRITLFSQHILPNSKNHRKFYFLYIYHVF